MALRPVLIASVSAALAFLITPEVEHHRAAWGVPSAEAAVAVAATLDELVSRSSDAVLVEAVEHHARWEQVAGSRRIVTYTKLAVVGRAFGPGEGELWVRTLGGAVGRIGQQVSGEASFHVGRQSLVFLTHARDGALVVTEMAQGHYPVERVQPEGEAARRALRPSRHAGVILRRRGPSVAAREILAGKAPADALEIIRQARAEHDARRK